MDQNNEADYLRKVCRTCLLSSENMLSIFSSIEVPALNDLQLPVVDLLNIFTDISVSPNDGFPDNICSDCLDKIHQTYTFKLKCEKSEAILKQLKKDDKIINLINSPNEFEKRIALIKTEKQEIYEILENEHLEHVCAPEIIEHEIVSQEISLVQEVKQELAIEINMEGDSNETEVGLFHCDDCSQKFRYNDDLKSHIQTEHAIVKMCNVKFKCTTCSSLFDRKSYLYRHMKIHTEVKLFQCEICPNNFRAKRYLKDHKRRVHGVNSEAS